MRDATRPYSRSGEVFRQKLAKLDDAQAAEFLDAIKRLLKAVSDEDRKEFARTTQRLGLL